MMHRIIIDSQPFDPDEYEMDAFAEGLDRAKETMSTLTQDQEKLDRISDDLGPK